MHRVIVIIWVVITTILGSFLALAISVFERDSRRIHPVGKLWARGILFIAGVTVRTEGTHHVQPGQSLVFMANHQSMVDILVLFACLPVQFRWLAKKELFHIPLFGPALARAGYIRIDRSNRKAAHKSLLAAAQKIASGVSVIIFPEGSRSSDDRLKPFKPGGFHLALRAERPIVPIAIYGTHQVLPKGSIHFKPGCVIVRIAPPVSTTRFGKKGKNRLMREIRDVMQTDLARIKSRWTHH
jgi:1-acyl-sn-glycerol-3-phosphate acyltransferase